MDRRAIERVDSPEGCQAAVGHPTGENRAYSCRIHLDSLGRVPVERCGKPPATIVFAPIDLPRVQPVGDDLDLAAGLVEDDDHV